MLSILSVPRFHGVSKLERRIPDNEPAFRCHFAVTGRKK
jgi:3-hydroxymyristoyl/3-hydroxydecanoyl-(acyl carrier protein) dehydratase